MNSADNTSPEDAALLVAYVDGDLGLPEAAAFEQRLATEPALAAALQEFLAADELGRTLSHLDLMPAPGLPPAPVGQAQPRQGDAQPQRRRSLRLVPMLLSLAAVACLLWLLQPSGKLQCRVVELAAIASRDGGKVGLRYHLDLAPARPTHVAVFAVAMQAGSPIVAQQFPPHPEQLAAPQVRSWPVNPLPAGSTTVPPAGADAFELRCDGGPGQALVLVAQSSTAMDPSVLEAALARLRRTLLNRSLDQPTAAALQELLDASGWATQVVWLQPPG